MFYHAILGNKKYKTQVIKESSTRRIEVVLWNLFNISKYQSIYEVHKIKVKEDLISYIRVTWVQPAAEQKRGTYN